jgi:hypothetical protein
LRTDASNKNFRARAHASGAALYSRETMTLCLRALIALAFTSGDSQAVNLPASYVFKF